MQSGLYVAISAQVALQKRLDTIADNVANANTVGFRATEVKFEDVVEALGNRKVAFVSPGTTYLSGKSGGLTQTGNPLDFAVRGEAWFGIETPAGTVMTRDGRFTMLETGDLVTLEGFPVLREEAQMIALATTPQPMATPSAVASGSGASREDAPGFADLVTRQGSARTSPMREAEGEAMPSAGDDEATPIGDREAARSETDLGGEAPAGGVPSWPARGLHEVLATLFRDDGTESRGNVEPAPEAVGEVLAGKTEASGKATETDEEDAAETGGDTGTSDDADDPEASAGMAAVAAAMTLPAQSREQRPGATSTPKPADHPADATPPAAKTEARGNETARDEGARSGGERRGESAAEAGNGRGVVPEGGDMKVRVIGETVIPTPGPLQNQRTIADLVATIASDGEWTGAMERPTAPRPEAANTPVGPVRDLRIQLNPAELGSVDARLRIVGEQLSVEIRVESGEAFRRLSPERDAIVSALRGLGFAVDDVSIQLQSPTSGQAQAGAGGRQNDSSGGPSQGTGRDQQGEGGAAGGRRLGDEQGGQNGDALIPATRPAGGGLYI